MHRWIEFGLPGERFDHAVLVRRWTNEARGKIPVIDRIDGRGWILNRPAKNRKISLVDF